MTAKIGDEVLVGFLQEARGYLPKINGGLKQLHADPGHADAAAETRRLLHSLKGAASMLGLATLSHVAFFGEDLLDTAKADARPLTSAESRVLRLVGTRLETCIESMLSGQMDQKALLGEVLAAVRRLKKLPPEEDQAELNRLYDDGQESDDEPPAPAAVPEPPPPPAAALAPDLTQHEDSSPELVETFRQEAEEHLQNIGNMLRELERRPGEHTLLDEVRRAVHTLKGAASMMGFPTATRLAHRMEDLLDRLREEPGEVAPERLRLLFETADTLEDVFAGQSAAGFRETLARLYETYATLLGSSGEGSARTPSVDELRQSLGEEAIIDLRAGPDAAVAREERPADGTAAARTGQVVRVPLERLDELVRLVSELVVNRSTFEEHHVAFARQVQELNLSLERLRRISVRLESDFEVAALLGSERPAVATLAAVAGGAAPASGGGSGEFDDLEFDRYSEFHLLSRELTETGSDISAVGAELTGTIGDFEGYLNRLGRLTSEIQDKLMRLRMVPLATLATRLHRTVRVTANQKGKQVELIIEGEQVELEKSVLEEMADPLLHLLRNAVDHGVEPAELRRVLGKPEVGKIHLQARYEGTQVVIQVRDDGSGLDTQAVRSAAIAGGFVSETDAGALSEAEVRALVFLPGFSTAREVSEVSGRGVGLDVVRSKVHQMEGTLAADGTPGREAVFTIRLPMTLAITRVLLVRARRETLAIPMAAVSQIMRLQRDELDRLGSDPAVNVDGRAFPLRQLGEALGLEATTEEATGRVPILLVDLGHERVALAVDELLEAREVVVKTLGTLLRRVPGITGATLMGDGSVVLIVNPTDLDQHGVATGRGQALTRAQLARRRALEVLIVDDSLSVRRVLDKLVRNAGWQPLAAKDGLEALELLQRSARKPDVILLDIEMPRMDGYELTAALRGQENFRDLPIVMITSRAGDKHRTRALSLGVNEYLVKPFQEDTLLNVIQRLASASHEAPTP